MIDMELYVAEELDTCVEAHQLGQPVEPPPDLPLEEWQLANKLLGISAIVLPNAQFMDNLENQIQAAARKSTVTDVPGNKTTPIGQLQELNNKISPYPQFRRRQPLWLSQVASIIIDLLLIFFAPSSLSPSEWHKRTPYD